jgi:hypothetical protein
MYWLHGGESLMARGQASRQIDTSNSEQMVLALENQVRDVFAVGHTVTVILNSCIVTVLSRFCQFAVVCTLGWVGCSYQQVNNGRILSAIGCNANHDHPLTRAQIGQA